MARGSRHNAQTREAHAPHHAAPSPSTPKAGDEPVVEPELIERLLDAQQDINLAANATMDQSLCDASALIDEIEPILRRALASPFSGISRERVEELAEDAFNEGWRDREARPSPMRNSRAAMRSAWLDSNARDAILSLTAEGGRV